MSTPSHKLTPLPPSLSLQWDVERTRIPVSSVLVGGGVIAAVSTYFGQKWWTKRHAGLITDFVDDMVSLTFFFLLSCGRKVGMLATWADVCLLQAGRTPNSDRSIVM
jgi:hypothetical protein